jgi:competence protein ComEC
MHPGLLVIPMIAGIVWTESGRALPAHVLFWGSLVAVTASAALLRSIVRDRTSPRGSSAATRGRIVFGAIAAASLSFVAGAERLGHELSRADRDAELAQEALGTGLRVAEARIRSRRSGPWGDELELVSVLAVDGETPLPASLLLRLPAPRAVTEKPGAVDPPSSRAARLLTPGAWVRVGVHVAPYRTTRNPGSTDRARQRRRRGLSARARLAKPGWVLSVSKRSQGHESLLEELRRWRSSWRKRMVERLAAEGSSGGIVAALALGDRSEVRPDTREAFRRLGLSHLLAVSGLHVGLVAGLGGWLFFRLGACLLRRGTPESLFNGALGVALGLALLYAWTTGGGVSVERATLLFALYALCRVALKSLTPTKALSWVAIGILWVEPALLFDVGAQLSFGACAALILAGFWTSGAIVRPPSDPESSLFGKVYSVGKDTFRASLAISLGTAPVLVQAGMSLATLGPLVNVVAIPWLGFVVLPMSLFAVWFAGILPSAVLSGLTLPAMLLESTVVRTVETLPAVSERALLGFPTLVLASALGLYWVRRNQWPRAACVWIGIALAGAMPFTSYPSAHNRPRVVFFDMGQGDATLVEGNEAVLLIDTGPGAPNGTGGRELVRALRSAGITSIDVLAVTHADLDHRAGAHRVLASFVVDELWLPGTGVADTPLVALADAARVHGTRVRWLFADAPRTDRGDLTIEVLWPPDESPGTSRSRNENSLVLRVGLGESDFLFTADIGVAVERALLHQSRSLAADVLKVGHHGSRRSSSPAFLEAVGASVVVVSAPCDPTRGLPSPLTLARLRHARAALWWTGRDGAVTVSRSHEGRLSVQSWGSPRRCERS